MLRLSASVVTLTLILLVPVAYAQYTAPTPPPPGHPSPSGLSAVRAQAKVAGTHAGFAAGAATVSAAKEHLGHALACIEGPSGANVKPMWENPCKGMGRGVLVDLRGLRANPSLLQKARTADASAVAAMKSGTLSRIRAAAKQVSTLMLQIAQTK